jgi:ABC-2 type transport system permease protein
MEGPEQPDAGEALVSFGIATAVRDGAISVGIGLGLLYLFPILGPVIGIPGWRRYPQHTGPMTGGLKLPATTALTVLSTSPWAGLGVLAAGAAAALLVGVLLLRLRDA